MAQLYEHWWHKYGVYTPQDELEQCFTDEEREALYEWFNSLIRGVGSYLLV